MAKPTLSRYQRQCIAYRIVHFGETTKQLAYHYGVTGNIIAKVKMRYVNVTLSEKYPLEGPQKPVQRLKSSPVGRYLPEK